MKLMVTVWYIHLAAVTSKDKPLQPQRRLHAHGLAAHVALGWGGLSCPPAPSISWVIRLQALSQTQPHRPLKDKEELGTAFLSRAVMLQVSTHTPSSLQQRKTKQTSKKPNQPKNNTKKTTTNKKLLLNPTFLKILRLGLRSRKAA